MKRISSVILILMSTHSSAQGVSLGVLELRQKIGDRTVIIPTAMDLLVQSRGDSFDIQVKVDMDLTDLQRQIDPIAKSLPVPRDNCASYGQNVVARIKGASLMSARDMVRVDVDAHVEIWDCQKGLFGTGPWKNMLFSDDVLGKVVFALASPDGQRLELVPSNVEVLPRGDIGKFLNRVAGFFQKDLTSFLKDELAALIHAGTLRQSIPREISEYDPEITHATFRSLDTGGLEGSITFKARLTGEQLNRMIVEAIRVE